MTEQRTCACGCGEIVWRTAKAIKTNKSGLFFKNREHHDRYSREHHPRAGSTIQRGRRRVEV